MSVPDEQSQSTPSGGRQTRSRNRGINAQLETVEPTPAPVEVIEDSQDEDFTPGMFPGSLSGGVANSQKRMGWLLVRYVNGE